MSQENNITTPAQKKETVGDRIKAVRKNLNISQENLAEKVNIDPAALSRIENDHRVPDANLLKSICEKLNISSDYILWGKENPFVQPLNITLDEKRALSSLYHKLQTMPDCQGSLRP